MCSILRRFTCLSLRRCLMPPKPTAVLPDPADRLDCRLIDPPHFCVLGIDTLLQQCDLRTQRRSGPGGQHRNKTSSGVFLTHRPTDCVGEATERRSQAQNREVALDRLRFTLAIEIRTPSPLDRDHGDPDESAIRLRYHGHSLRLNDANEDKPAVLSLVLNDLWAAGGQPSLVADLWGVSTSRIVGLVRSVPAALTWVNRVRAHHKRWPLR